MCSGLKGLDEIGIAAVDWARHNVFRPLTMGHRALIPMPHAILEYSDNILDDADFVHMLSRLHELLVETGGCNPREIKSRVYRVEHYRVGDGSENNSFAHLTIRVKEGRPPEMHQRMGEAALGLLREHYSRSLEQQRCDLTVEIHQMKRDCYFKISSAGN
jgi:5-carboxymethyl-2-hydroxymuconate isomerase